MKSRLFVVLVFALFVIRSEALGQCGNNFGMANGESICMGYAMARASGLDHPTTWNARTIARGFFYPLRGKNDYQVGDIIVFDMANTPEPNISADYGHAAYVAEIRYGNKPDGVISVGASGIWRDTDDHPTTDDDNVICDQVGYGGGPEEIGKTLTQIKAERAMAGNVLKGYYRLRNEFKCKITFENSFGPGYSQVDVGKNADGVWANHTSPKEIYFARKATVDAKAITPQLDQSGAWQYFEKWDKNNELFAWGAQMSIDPVIGVATYSANFTPDAPEGSMVSFENRSYGVSFGSIIKVNGQDNYSPTPDYPLGTQAVAYSTLEKEGLLYTFINWSTGSTSLSLTPSAPGRYVANYSTAPLPPTLVVAGGPVGSNVSVNWTDNPNSNVTLYRIYRMLKNAPWSQVGYAYQGAQQWIDDSYTITGTGSDQFIEYGVTSVYGPTSAESDRACAITYATFQLQKKGDKKGVVITSQSYTLPREYAVSNYPNPFNPSTTISYQLVEDASVRLEIYDVMGSLIATLVNGYKTGGNHSTMWNGTAQSGKNVASGMYLYRFIAQPTSGQKAFTSTGKLLLMK